MRAGRKFRGDGIGCQANWQGKMDMEAILLGGGNVGRFGSRSMNG